MAVCNACGFNNPPGMKFCGNCGTRLEDPAAPAPKAAPAPAITATEQVGVMMGADLQERFRAAGLEASGQRRQVTVLFVDLTGYTQISGKLDNEDVFELIQQYIRLMVNEVYKYEGIVDKLTGDGLMALYGAPIAHENNAERALRSAVDMQASLESIREDVRARLGVDLSMHIGLHSGSVIVGGVGSNLLMDYTAIGDTVNLARRIEEAAQPGTILVSESVYQQTRRLFDFTAIPGLALKGYDQPLTAYRYDGIKTQPGLVRGLEGLHAPMIGRDAELERLRQAVDALAEQGLGHLVMVTGEAGIGKSRLKRELRSHLEGSNVRILEGSSLTYRRSISYWLFLEILRSDLGITPGMSPAQTGEVLAREVGSLLGGRAAGLLPYLEHLLGAAHADPAAAERLQYLDASQLRQQIFLAVRDLLQARSSRQPLLLILEDLHWADDASLDLLNFLLEAVRTSPIMIYAISRPFQEGALQKAADWAGKHLGDRFIALRLQSLSRDQANHLLFQLLTISDLPEKMRTQILERSAGVPFYLEEILRMLIDRGILQRREDSWQIILSTGSGALGVPDTLQGLILARFDRLNEQQRRILQVASVIGHQFTTELLAAMLPANGRPNLGLQADLDTLTEREYIDPLNGGTGGRYAFRHVLMSEAIYGTMLKRDRSRLHGDVGEAIERLYAGQLDEQVELLARHYSWSSKLDRALHYLTLAGEKAAAGSVNAQARQHYEQALEVLARVEHTPEQARKVYTGLGDALTISGEYPAAAGHYTAALETLDGAFTPQRAGAASGLQRKIARTLERQGNYDEAVRCLNAALEVLEHSPAPLPVEQAQVLSDIGWIHYRLGDFPQAENLLLQGLGLVKDTSAFDAISSIYNRLGGLTYTQGDWARTAEYLRKSIVIRESIGEVNGLATSLNNLGLMLIEMGDYPAALENLTRAYELKTRLGLPEGIGMALVNLGWLRTQRGEIEEAARCLNQAMEVARQIGYSSLLGQVLKNIGEMHLASQDWGNARGVLQETADLLVELRAHDQLVDTYRLMGEAALGEGNLEDARAFAEKIQNITISLGAGTTELSTVQRGEFWRFRGLLAVQMGEFDPARRFLEESQKIFDVLGSRLYQGRAAFGQGVLARACQDHPAARQHFEEAARLFNGIGALLEEQRAMQAASAL